MTGEATRIQTDLVPAEEVAGQKAVLRTRCERARESSGDEASQLVDGQLYAGDWRFAKRCEAIERITAEQIRSGFESPNDRESSSTGFSTRPSRVLPGREIGDRARWLGRAGEG